MKQKEEVVGHFDEELVALKEDLGSPDLGALEDVKASITAIDEALGVKFQEFDQVLESMPERIRLIMISGKGVAMKAMYKEAVEGETELEEYVEGTLDPAEIAMAKIESIEPSEKWAGEHPIGKMIVEAGKEILRMKMDEARGIVNMKRVPGLSGRKRGFG